MIFLKDKIVKINQLNLKAINCFKLLYSFEFIEMFKYIDALLK